MKDTTLKSLSEYISKYPNPDYLEEDLFKRTFNKPILCE